MMNGKCLLLLRLLCLQVLAVQQIGSRQLLVNVSAALPVSTDQAALAAQDLSAGAQLLAGFECPVRKPVPAPDRLSDSCIC
jgi:hypothetical protein